MRTSEAPLCPGADETRAVMTCRGATWFLLLGGGNLALEAVKGADSGPTGRKVRGPSRPDLGMEEVLAARSSVVNRNRDHRHKSDEVLVARLDQQLPDLLVEPDFLAERSGP